MKKNILPPCCVINGLQNISIPTEISKLDPLSMQLIQRAIYNILYDGDISCIHCK